MRVEGRVSTCWWWGLLVELVQVNQLSPNSLRDLGALVIDADQLARMAIERGSDGFADVMLRFGEDVIINGDIDRKKLAEIVFSDEQARKDLEAIIHPRVQALFAEAVARFRPR